MEKPHSKNSSQTPGIYEARFMCWYILRILPSVIDRPLPRQVVMKPNEVMNYTYMITILSGWNSHGINRSLIDIENDREARKMFTVLQAHFSCMQLIGSLVYVPQSSGGDEIGARMRVYPFIHTHGPS
jgi:hypothetical protein